MVSQFREFLNTSPRFQELRDSLPYRAGGSRARGAAARRSNAMANNLPTAEGEGFDDEMADEENDFEGMDGSEMAVDAQVQNQHHNQLGSQHNPLLPQAAPTIPIPPPAPSLSQHPFADAGSGAPVAAHPYAYHPSAYHPPAPLGPLAFSSFINNEAASGAPPLSAHGHVQASMAPLSSDPGPSTQGASTANGAPATASTAPVQWPYHQDPLGE